MYQKLIVFQPEYRLAFKVAVVFQNINSYNGNIQNNSNFQSNLYFNINIKILIHNITIQYYNTVLIYKTNELKKANVLIREERIEQKIYKY